MVPLTAMPDDLSGDLNGMEATRRSPGAGRVPADGQIPAAELASRCPGKFREERPR